MKTKVTLLAIATLFLTFCGGKNKETAGTENTETSNYEWVDVDLSTSTLKYPVVVQSRKGSKVVVGTFDTADLENDDMILNYSVSAYSQGMPEGTVERVKKDVKENTIYKFEKFIVDTPDSYIAKTSAGYIVGRFVKAKDITYECSIAPLFAIEKEEDAKELHAKMGMLRAK
jgi:hypothetical protein